MKRFIRQTTLLTLLFTVFLSAAYSQTPRTIRILTIGNSFSEDAVENYLYELGAAENINFIIGNAYIGGCSLERHRNNADKNLSEYAYRKIEDGNKTTEKNTSLDYCILDEPWDYISFQQVSGDSGIYSTYFPFLNELLTYTKGKASNPEVKYILHRTWAYAKNSNHSAFTNYDKDQPTMYKAIVETTNRVKENTPDISFIIPAGTAIQNGRTSAVGDRFCRDGYHLDFIIGRYTAACTWFEKITGINVVGNPAAPEGLSNYRIQVAQNAAHLAVLKPDEVTSMEGDTWEYVAPIPSVQVNR